MALQIWMPLTSDIHNQGLADITPQIAGTSITYTSGKIGNAVTFPNNCASYIYMDGLKLQTGSWCAWIKVLGEGSGASQRIISEGRDTGSIGTNIFVNKTGTTLTAHTHKRALQTTISLNTWYHVAITFGNGIFSLYINGNLLSSISYTEDSDYAQSNDKLVLGKMSYGYTSANNYFPLNGQLNDVRIYDHCLSPREIKEISKGLVLHYPLNREGFGQDNLLSRYVSPGQQNPGVTASAGRTKFYGDYGIIIPATENADTYFRLFLRKQLTSNAVYTISCQVSGLIDGTYYLFPLFTQGNSSMGVLRLDHNGFNSMTFTMTYGTQTAVTVGSETVYICFLDDAGRSIAAGQGPITVTNFKIEEGSTATPFVPAPTDALYTKMGLDDNIVYDTSGFQHNGELVVIGKNLIDKNNVTSGGYINSAGSITPDSVWNYTNYIKVKPSTSYVASSISSGGSGTYFALYDVSKTLTRTVLITANQNPTFTTTAAERYVRFSIRSASNELDTAKLEGGTTVTAYDSEGSIEWETNSPRYTLACNPHSANSTQNAKPGTTYIRGDCALTNPNQLTIAFWCYARKQGYGTAISQGMFCTTNYPAGNDNIGVDYQNSAMNHRDGAVDVNNSAANQHIRLGITFIENEWHHYAFTYDGQNAKSYKDGVLQDTKSFSVATTLGSFSSVVLGLSRAGSVWRRNDNTYSDLRVYSTCLDIDDIKALYQIPISLSSDGTLFAGEFVEG